VIFLWENKLRKRKESTKCVLLKKHCNKNTSRVYYRHAMRNSSKTWNSWEKKGSGESTHKYESGEISQKKCMKFSCSLSYMRWWWDLEYGECLTHMEKHWWRNEYHCWVYSHERTSRFWNENKKDRWFMNLCSDNHGSIWKRNTKNREKYKKYI